MASNQIKSGTKFDVTFDRQIDFYGREVTFPVELSFAQPGKGTVSVDSDEDGQFTAVAGQMAANPKPKWRRNLPPRNSTPCPRLAASLYSTAQDQKIPDYIIAEFTHVFSYDVDFQRQVGASDTFELFLRQSALRFFSQAQSAAYGAPDD